MPYCSGCSKFTFCQLLTNAINRTTDAIRSVTSKPEKNQQMTIIEHDFIVKCCEKIMPNLCGEFVKKYKDSK